VESVPHVNYVEPERTMQRNITLALDDDLIRKAKVLAARRNLSVSALLREELSRLVFEDEAYETAKRAALERLERGSHLGGGPLPSRDELHDRAGLR
jgi:predicted transcriptional regulator